ncbi:MAG TPA: RelA/SpoT AH/RIS domain-containing protein, partial [Rhizomicrobium sp.]|nr:RelA/SpoT AH/RIS domain-containing protein [Rhizomicrobium sp.]
IHTTVMGPEKQRVEIQIRTQEMHDVAERGVAAHWRYREHVPDKGDESAAYAWLRDMVDLLERGDSAEEVLENSRLNMYADQVFCFTPKGSLISLPRGATPIDFAYAVHTDLGHTAVGAKVNGGHVPLHTQLHNGDQVEIISTKDSAPSPLWEQFVVTGRARAEIRRYLRHAQRDQHVKLGKKILEKAFAEHGAQLSEKAIEEVAKKLRLAKTEDVYADVGRGQLRGREVLAAVFPELKRADKTRIKHGGPADAASSKPISIRGLTEGIAYALAPCCHPLPGDRIVGLMTPGEGVMVHTIDCGELDKAQSMDDWLDVSWGRNAAELGPSVARVAVRVKNEPGSLAQVMTVIANNGGNIFNMKVVARNPLFFEFVMDIEVRDVAHLQNIVGALRVNNAVESVDRVRDAEHPEKV